MIQQNLNQEVIKRFNTTHEDVVTYFKYEFPPLFTQEVYKGNCSLTFTQHGLGNLNFGDNVDLWDVFIIVKALGYKVDLNNTAEMSFTIRF